MKNKRDEALIATTIDYLNGRAESLPPHAVRRLQEARLQALTGRIKTHRPWLALPRWVTTGGLATAAVALLTVSLWVVVPRPQPTAVDAELEQIVAKEQLELYEDLEFFRWLAANK